MASLFMKQLVANAALLGSWGLGQAAAKEYPEIRYIAESDDPSLTLETRELVVKVIDNTGLLTPPIKAPAYFNASHRVLPYSHHLGYHGIRTLYNRTEGRNIVIPLSSWLNLQHAKLEGIPVDEIDQRAWAGDARGWPVRLQPRGKGAMVVLDPLPSMQMRYSLELQPAEPDAVDFRVRFEFGRRPASGPARFSGSWPCYISAYDDVRFYYPQGASASSWRWASIGERPSFVVGEAVNYKHEQTSFRSQDQALPFGYGRIGDYALIIMFDDPRVKFFVVNGGGHLFFSSVQNPAWDFSWTLEDYPVNKEVGFDGRLIYTRFRGPDDVQRRYRAWLSERSR